MKIIKFNSVSAFLLLIFLNKAFGQCPPSSCPPPSTTPIPSTLVMKYKGFYIGNFITGASPTNQKKHSKSVDFSREAIINLYSKVFITDVAKGYQGINIHFIAFGKRFLPRHSHNDQIGLMITAADVNCKTDPDEFNISNNSFNQSSLQNDHTPSTNYCSRDELDLFKGNYVRIYRNNTTREKLYTKYVHHDKIIIEYFYRFLIAYPTFKGLRFDFACYNSRVGCGQVDDKQITLMISPVRSDGTADLTAFLNYLKEKVNDNDKVKIYNTLNHGSLCPNYCE